MNSHIPFDANNDWTLDPYHCNQSNDPLVDKVIGNAYAVVRAVYCNLGNLKLLYDFLNTYGMVIGVKSEADLKKLNKLVKYARIYGYSSTNDRQVTDYLYVPDDTSGIRPDDPTATGSWIKVATSATGGGGEGTGQGAYIPYVYANGSALGGETSFKVPDGTIGVPFLIINGSVQYIGFGFTYSAATATVTLSNPLVQGDEVIALTTAIPANPDNPEVPGWVQVNWLYNNGSAVGGEQVITVPYNFQDVPAVYKNGLRLYKGLQSNSYVIDKDTHTITMTEILAQGDRVIVTLGGESETLTVTDRTLQEVARAHNLKDSDVTLSTTTNLVITGKRVIYDVTEQKAWGLPDLPPNAYLVKIEGNKLTYNPGNVIVDLLPVPDSVKELENTLKSADGASNVVTSDGSTVEESLNTMHESITTANTDIGKNAVAIAYAASDYKKQIENVDGNTQYAAFCDCTLMLGDEVFIHRLSKTHLDDGGGVSTMQILRKENGKLVPKYTFNAISGYDYRDPSITWEPVTRRLVVTVQLFNVANSSYNGGNVYIFSNSFTLLSSFTIGSSNSFQWGKALRTPTGKMLIAAYDTASNQGVRLFTSTGSFDSPVSFTQVGTVFGEDASLSRTEVSIHYWKEFLVAVARTQDVDTQSLQNISLSYTRDLSGATGWVTPVRIAVTGVAPRMLTMPDGALCVTCGSIFSGFRGSVAGFITYDLVTFSTPTTVFQATTGNGGYHGAMFTKTGLAIYSYIETVSLTKSATWLAYFNPEAVQMIKRSLNIPLNFHAVNNVTYLGEGPFGTGATTEGGYVTIYLKEAVNNCRGLVLNLGGSMTSAQAVLLQNSDGTTYATLGGVTASSVGTYYASHSGLNIPAGMYRISVSKGYVCTGNRRNSTSLTYPDNRIYGLVNINGTPSSAGQDVFVGFAV